MLGLRTARYSNTTLKFYVKGASGSSSRDSYPEQVCCGFSHPSSVCRRFAGMFEIPSVQMFCTILNTIATIATAFTFIILFPPSSGVEPMSPYRVPDQRFPCVHFFVETSSENCLLSLCIKLFPGSKYHKIYIFCFENRSTGPDMCCYSCLSVSGGNFASTRAPVC